jgi:hypothetical protein
LSWQPGGTPEAMPAYTGETGLLGQLSPTDWLLVNENPMSVRFVDGNGPQRFCAFVRGDQLVEDGIPQDYMQVSIAVVYPAANGRFPGAASGNPWGDCDGIDVGLLTPGNRDDLELTGLRVTFMSTAVRPLS